MKNAFDTFFKLSVCSIN